jgi:hypothetical protein
VRRAFLLSGIGGLTLPEMGIYSRWTMSPMEARHGSVFRAEARRSAPALGVDAEHLVEALDHYCAARYLAFERRGEVYFGAVPVGGRRAFVCLVKAWGFMNFVRLKTEPFSEPEKAEIVKGLL